MVRRSTFLNFAYGCNMCSARLRARTPSARAVAIGELADHTLRWHKRSEDGSGKCDAFPDESARMWGVVYEIDAREKPLLDAAEGLHHGCEEKWVEVATADGVVTAQTHVASDSDPTVRPYDWYKAFVVHGAVEHGLPATYVEELRRVEAVADPDRERARRNRAILEPDPLVWPVRIVLVFLAALFGFGAAIASFALSPGLVLPVILLGFLSAGIALASRHRYWRSVLIGGAMGLVSGGALLIWVLSQMAGAY